MNEEIFDVVVVGGGGAGLAAAVEAASGGSVVVLEKAARPGGTTAMAVGSITASGTRYQRRLGISDSPEEHLADYRVYAGERVDRDNPDLSRLLVENVGATVDWLSELGVEFFGPMREPPHRKPRMHNVLPSARSYIYHLKRRAEALGAEIRTGISARALRREDGSVVGVEAEGRDGAVTLYRARRGVVLAGGDFSNDPAFRRTYLGAATVPYAAANRDATGDCQRMAMAIGARICNADLFEGAQMRFPPPPSESWLLRLPPLRLLARPMRWALDHLPARLIRPFALGFVTTYLAPDTGLFRSGALLVDERGERLASLQDRDRSVARAFVILDAALYRKFCAYPHYIATAPNVAFAYADDFRRTRPDIFFTAPDLATLARRIGVPDAALTASAAAHNALTASSGDEEIAAIRSAPFHALGPVLPYVLTTHGGLAVSNDLAVLDTEDRPIARLYAAGSAGRGGALLPGHGHSLGWAFTSGRIAGRNASGRTPA